MNEYMQYLAQLIPEKDSLKLVKDEAKKYYKSHSLDDCFDMGIELYQSDNFQIQEVGVFLLGYSAHHNASALSFLKNTVSQHDSWKVQEILAMAFDKLSSWNLSSKEIKKVYKLASRFLDLTGK